MTVLLYLVAAVSGVAFLHPYLFYPLSLRLMRPRPLPPGAGPRPSASLLFAAYNEERAIPAKLENIAAIKALHPDLEVLAYSDMSTDATLDLLRARPDLLRALPAAERTGKATGMRRMVDQARGEICIFTDANVLLDPQSVGPMLDYFRNPEIGGVAGTLHYVNDDASATAEAGGIYWRMEEGIKRLESRCGSIMGADGSIFATRRALYPQVPPHLLDDMIASMSVLFHGHRMISAPDVLAYERNATAAADEFRRKRRIACRAWNSYRHIGARIARLPLSERYKFVSHKVLRWFGASLLVLSGAALAAALWLDGRAMLLAALALAGGLLIIAALVRVRPARTLMGFASAIFATFVGLTDAWRGRTWQIWRPAQSRD